MLGAALVTGFSQVAKSQEVRNFMVRGRDISAKHIEIFGSVLSEDHLPPASKWDAEATDSTVSPFSYNLMMFHVTALISIGISHYGVRLRIWRLRQQSPNPIILLSVPAAFPAKTANFVFIFVPP
jgi:hypothetical protein